MQSFKDCKRTCPTCNKEYVPSLVSGLYLINPLTQTVRERKYREWQQGGLVQYIYAHQTSTHREQLTSGICSDECWDHLYLGDGYSKELACPVAPQGDS